MSQEDSRQAELEAAGASADAPRADLEAERRKSGERRERFEAEVDRLEAKLARSEQVAAERREALLGAQAQLRRPLVRLAAKAARVVDWLGRVISLRRRERPSTGGRAGAAVGASPQDLGQVEIERRSVADTPATPRIAIHIAPRTWEAAATWGDTHFAQGLQRAFERQGWSASVHLATEADTPDAIDADVGLHLFGKSVPAVRPGQLSILWIISHPDRVRPSLARAYDLVFAASESFAVDLAGRIDRPVRALLQATDPDRFHPDPSGPRHALLFIGNSRGARRPILDALAGTDHDLAVYGGAWTPELLDPRYLSGTWIPNEDLHRYYSGAEIVLNDHWADMQQEGFVSNRVYDALASGAFVVSDAVPGIEERFDGSVATFESRDELIAVVDHYLAHPAERQERATRGRAAVLARHTFDHRAAAIIEATRGSLVRDRQSA